MGVVGAMVKIRDSKDEIDRELWVRCTASRDVKTLNELRDRVLGDLGDGTKVPKSDSTTGFIKKSLLNFDLLDNTKKISLPPMHGATPGARVAEQDGGVAA